MPIRVELTDDAVSDLERLATSGSLQHFLAKLVKLENDGEQASEPLGKDLASWRKIVVGDRTWRIVFISTPDKTVATVWVIGDRSDEQCYKDALARVERNGDNTPATQTLATVLNEILKKRTREKKTKTRRN